MFTKSPGEIALRQHLSWKDIDVLELSLVEKAIITITENQKVKRGQLIYHPIYVWMMKCKSKTSERALVSDII